RVELEENMQKPQTPIAEVRAEETDTQEADTQEADTQDTDIQETDTDEYESITVSLPQPEPALEPSRLRRERKPVVRFGFEEQARVVLEDSEPLSYREALESPDVNLWITAMEEEIAALHRNNTFTEVERPANRKIVDCKWVFKIKRRSDGSIERYKARLVAKGFSQIPGLQYDEVFAPVIRYESLRLLLALSAHNNWIPRQFDIKSAFLHGDLK